MLRRRPQLRGCFQSALNLGATHSPITQKLDLRRLFEDNMFIQPLVHIIAPHTCKRLVSIASGHERLVHFQWFDRHQNIVEDDQIVFLDKEGPNGSIPFQVSEDMVEDDISSSNAILLEPNLGREVSRGVTSSYVPVKLKNLQRSAVLDAGKIVRLNPLCLSHENTATALTYDNYMYSKVKMSAMAYNSVLDA